MHGYMAKLGNPFLTQWQRRYFYLFPNRLEWRGEGESPVRRARGEVEGGTRQRRASTVLSRRTSALADIRVCQAQRAHGVRDVHKQAWHCQGCGGLGGLW